MSGMRLVVGGPPHSGKSTFTAGLISAIRDRKREQSYNISMCYMTLDLQDNSLNAIMNDESRKTNVKWTDENVSGKVNEFQSKSKKLVIADAPGKTTDELKALVKPADKMILLVNNNKKDVIGDWRDIANAQNIDVMFTLYSITPDTNKDPGWKDGSKSTREGTICSISRDDIGKNPINPYDPTSKRMIRQIADIILQKVSA